MRLLNLHIKLIHCDKLRNNETEGFSDEQKYEATLMYYKLLEELESLDEI